MLANAEVKTAHEQEQQMIRDAPRRLAKVRTAGPTESTAGCRQEMHGVSGEGCQEVRVRRVIEYEIVW